MKMSLRQCSSVALFALVFLSSQKALTREPNWSKDHPVPADGRRNPYALPESQFQSSVRAGKLHALHYPVADSGIKVPYEPVRRLLAAQSDHPIKYLLMKLFGAVSNFTSFDQVENWLGLHSYPKENGFGSHEIPWPETGRPEHRMGFTVIGTPLGAAFTVSCAECHVGHLFGRKIIGMSNRFPRANEFFVRGLAGIEYISENLFRWQLDASPAEMEMFRNLKYSTRFIEAKSPAQLGLDTSLAQVSLSLAKRLQNPHREAYTLRDHVTDSKPAVWWTAKYKNRFLSDGSVVSGNPIFTNIIWNEVGRGTDLNLLTTWLSNNPDIIRDLTNAVFANEPPQVTDFFPAGRIDESEARRGEQIFNKTCARCHGEYEKAWSLPSLQDRPWSERLRTIAVHYPRQTPVVDVGTDPNRYLGMNYLTPLNDLDLSQKNGILIAPQKGYVPQPLVGIWARWPYLHNNAIPSLCVLLTPAERRPRFYWAREANNPDVDFDWDCNGYPMTEPANKDPQYLYDTRRSGMTNVGHSEGILVKDGVEQLTEADRRALIRFLQTL